MAKGFLSISSTGAQEWRELARALRKAGRGELRKELRNRVAKAGQPVVDDVKQAVLTLPVTSRGGGEGQRQRFNASRARTERAAARALKRRSGLRRAIASSTRLQITARGVKIIVSSNRLPENQQSLPRHLDSEKGWRHPVFGNRENWVHQQGRPYFGSTIRKKAPAFRQAILDAMDAIKHDIES